MALDPTFVAIRERDDARAKLSDLTELTADRDEARSEIRALREQRDEIRAAHRAEIEALKGNLRTLVEAASAVCEWDPARLEGNLYTEGLVADIGALRNATKAALRLL